MKLRSSFLVLSAVLPLLFSCREVKPAAGHRVDDVQREVGSYGHSVRPVVELQ